MHHFCFSNVLCWSLVLDEMWYYPLFTVLMLLVFESTVVFQRQRTLKEFRGMSIKPYKIWVYRDSTWIEIETDELLLVIWYQ